MIEDKKPGAARFGNFINYYEFNPPENRCYTYGHLTFCVFYPLTLN